MPEVCREAQEAVDDLQYEEAPKSFFPVDRLRDYFSCEKIREILYCGCKTCEEDLRMFNMATELKDYVDRIMGKSDPTDSRKSFYSVFGLLVYVGHPLFIVGFVTRNCNDYLLETWASHSSFPHDQLQQCTGEYKRDPAKYTRFRRRFFTDLPHFAIPHMESSGFSHYSESVVLPFVEEEEIGKRTAEDGHLTSEGANGRVFAFKIYREYNFPDISTRTEYVRKRIQTPIPEAFMEGSNMQYVQQFKDKHIVKLIKAYAHGESINLIFPRAWTNLDHLLRDPNLGYGSKRSARLETADAWKQLLGISSALKEMHGYGDKAKSRANNNTEVRICIHFDLKPDNILVEREGNWLITDFGQAALTEHRRSATPRVGGHFGTDAYAPPEIDDRSIKFGRSYDVWSLGCITLEVVAFMILGYDGLNGSRGLDQARRSMPSWSRNSDERFFYQAVPNGEFIVKRDIKAFKTNLEGSHAQSKGCNATNTAFLTEMMNLIDTMLEPQVTKRTNISKVVDILSNALAQATAEPTEEKQQSVEAGPDEIILGGPRVNQIKLWHSPANSSIMRRANLEVFEDEARFLRLHCRTLGREPSDVKFRRSDAKIVPLYAFWDPQETPESPTWIEFLVLSNGRCSKIPSSKYSFDERSGPNEARLIQSIVTSQNIVGSFNLTNVRLRKPLSVGKALKALFRKKKVNGTINSTGSDEGSSDLGSATVQIWIEQAYALPKRTGHRDSWVSRTSTTSRVVRHLDRDRPMIPPCRVSIYLHKQHFLCTVKVDLNWVMDESNLDPKVLFFKPLPTGRNRTFFASWLRPTPEEFAAEEQYPAGIPLDPRVLQYYEDVDCVEVEDIELTFRSADDREAFICQYLETKRDWDLRRQEVGDTVEVNREPDGGPQLPDGVNNLPVSTKRVPFFVNTGVDTELQSMSSTSTTRSRHDSTLDNATSPQNPGFLVVPTSQRR